MMTNKIDDEDGCAPKRDHRGRFRKGSTGNPHGRPPKPPEEPWSLQRCFAEALDEEVPVTEGSVAKTLRLREVVVKTLVRNIPKAKAREQLQILERLYALGALEPVRNPEGDWVPTFTNEDMQVLEIARKALEASHLCSKCHGPVHANGDAEDTSFGTP